VNFTTDAATDEKVKSNAASRVGTEYEISCANCADLSSDLAQSVGIDVKSLKELWLYVCTAVISKTFTDPHKQVNDAKNLDGANVKNSIN